MTTGQRIPVKEKETDEIESGPEIKIEIFKKRKTKNSICHMSHT